MQQIIRFLIMIIGFTLGYQLVSFSFSTIAAFAGVEATPMTNIGASIFGGVVFALITYIISPWLSNLATTINSWVETALKSIPTQDIAVGVT